VKVCTYLPQKLPKAMEGLNAKNAGAASSESYALQVTQKRDGLIRNFFALNPLTFNVFVYLG